MVTPPESTTDYFGFLGQPWSKDLWSVSFSQGRISPVVDCAETISALEKECHKDGYLYPPMSHDAVKNPDGSFEKQSQTERPAEMYGLPITHQITYTKAPGPDERRGRSAFLIHLLGFLAGHQVQFHDWWVTGRVPIKPHPPFLLHPKYLQGFINTAESVWDTLTPKKQKHLTNILYCWGRLFAYELLWEEFAFKYMLLDSVYRFHDLKGTKNTPKIETLCTALNITHDKDAAKLISDLRNDLFHESIWAGETFGFGGSIDQFTARLNLGNLLDQSIARTLGFSCPFPAWTVRSRIGLDPNKPTN